MSGAAESTLEKNLIYLHHSSDFVNVDILERVASQMDFSAIYREQRVRGIEPPCAAWEAAVLPLNYTRVSESEW